jgi:hypothetical protein
VVAGNTSKSKFRFSAATGKYVFGTALRSSDDSLMQLIHILQFFTKHVFYKPPEEKIQRNQVWRIRKARK